MKRITYTQFKQTFTSDSPEYHVYYDRREKGGHMLLHLSTALKKYDFAYLQELPKISVTEIKSNMNRDVDTSVVTVNNVPKFLLLKL